MKSCVAIHSDSRGKLQAIDYLKGFSIFTIALMHLLNYITAVPSKLLTLAAVGGTGVHVFFLCSGVGLYTSYLKHKTSYAGFLKKRFSKIYIPYIIVILISFLLPWMYEGNDRVTALLSHVFLFKMFVQKYAGSFGPQFWFVSTLFQLYAIFIPMCWLKDKLSNNKLFILIFGGISVFWWCFCHKLGIGDIRVWGSFCFQYIWEFAIGFVLAEAFYRHKRYKLNNILLLVLAVLGIGCQAFLALYSESLKVFNDVPALVGYLSLALLLSNIPVVKHACRKLAGFSYEYFLVHILVFKSVFYLLKPQGLLLQCAVGFLSVVIALAAAYLYHRLMAVRSLRRAG